MTAGSLLTNETIVRVAAFVAAIAVLSGPSVWARIKSVRWSSFLPSMPRRSDAMSDAHTILEIAGRLSAAGNTAGVELCQKLIDVMMSQQK